MCEAKIQRYVTSEHARPTGSAQHCIPTAPTFGHDAHTHVLSSLVTLQCRRSEEHHVHLHKLSQLFHLEL